MLRARSVPRSGFVAASSAVVLLAGVTCLVVWFSLAFLREGESGSPWWWPATGVALVFVLRAPRTWWVALIISYGIANGVASRGSDDAATMSLYALVNVIELAVTAAILGGVGRGRSDRRGGTLVRRADGVLRRSDSRSSGDLTSGGRSSTPRRAAQFVVAMVVAIGLGSAIIALSGLVGFSNAATYGVFSGYAVTHALGLLTLAPMLLPPSRPRRGSAAHRIETLAVVAAAVGISLLVFFADFAVARAFLTMLPLIWAAIRLDALRTTVISLATCAFAVFSATRDVGTFAEVANRGVRQDSVQLFVLTLGLTALVLVMITRHRAQLAELVRDSENTLRVAVRDALVGMYSIRFDPGHVGEIRDINTAMSALLGYQPDELIGASSRLIGLGPDYRERLDAAEIANFDAWMESFARGEPESFRRETPFYQRDGGLLWVEVSAIRVIPIREPPFALVHVHDLTNRFEQQQRLEQMALHDALTGVANRVLLFQRMTAALAAEHASGDRRTVGLLFVDLDNFKAINDTFGHAAGDAVLVEVARRLSAAVRPGDTVARLGGDEYAVLCHSVSHDSELDSVSARIRALLRDPIPIPGGGPVTVRPSIGAAVADDESTADTLMRTADARMYRDKQAEKGALRAGLAVSTDE